MEGGNYVPMFLPAKRPGLFRGCCRGLVSVAVFVDRWESHPTEPPSRVLDVFPPRVKSRQSEPTKTTASNGPGAVVPSVLVGRAAPPISRAEVCPSQRRSCPNTTLQSIGLYPPPGDVANPAGLKTPTPNSTLLAPIRNHRTEVRASDPLLQHMCAVMLSGPRPRHPPQPNSCLLLLPNRCSTAAWRG